MRTITGLSVKDKFMGLSNIKITSSSAGVVPGYYSSSNSGEFDILS